MPVPHFSHLSLAFPHGIEQGNPFFFFFNPTKKWMPLKPFGSPSLIPKTQQLERAGTQRPKPTNNPRFSCFLPFFSQRCTAVPRLWSCSWIGKRAPCISSSPTSHSLPGFAHKGCLCCSKPSHPQAVSSFFPSWIPSGWALPLGCDTNPSYVTQPWVCFPC